MPTRNLSPTGSALLTGTSAWQILSDVTAPTSTATFAGTASASSLSSVSAASAAVFASTATAYQSVDVIGASVALFTSTAAVSVVVDVTGGSDGTGTGTGTYDGEARDAWATNIDTKAVSRYIAFDFNSFATIGNRTYGFSDAGVFEITGSTDAGSPIPFFLMSESHSKTGGDVGLGMLQPHTAYVVGDLPESPSVVDLFIATDDDEVYSYPVGETDTRMSTARVLLGRGLRSRYLRYGLYGNALEPIEIASITIKAASSARNV